MKKYRVNYPDLRHIIIDAETPEEASGKLLPLLKREKEKGAYYEWVFHNILGNYITITLIHDRRVLMREDFAVEEVSAELLKKEEENSRKLTEARMWEIIETAEKECEKRGIKIDNVMRAENTFDGEGYKGIWALKTLGNILYAAFECHLTGRERALSKDRLEDAIMWAVRGYTKECDKER